MLDVDVLGLVRVTRAVLPVLRRSSAAVIVSACLVAATAGLPDGVLYSAGQLTDPCQQPLDTTAGGEWWAPAEEVFHLE